MPVCSELRSNESCKHTALLLLIQGVIVLGRLTLILRMKGSYAVLRNEQQNSNSASRASMDLLLVPGETDDRTGVHGKF